MLKHPRLAIALLVLRPGSNPQIDFRVQDDGAGPYLVEGSMKNPPTQEEVDALTDGELDAAQSRPWNLTIEEAVNLERDRRIFGGFTFNGARFQSRIEDQKRIAGAGTLALAAIIGGAKPGDYRWHGGDSDFAWIAEDNSLMPMDAQAVIAFGQAAAAHESKHVFAARALKNNEPIPLNYVSDKYWP